MKPIFKVFTSREEAIGYLVLNVAECILGQVVERSEKVFMIQHIIDPTLFLTIMGTWAFKEDF
jgi:hypothetical protein